MPNSYFQFKQFIIQQDKSAMKVTTDSCLFGAWAAKEISELIPSPSDLLDIGTGTGLLSLMVAQQNSGTIDAVEIDEDAAQQAVENVAASKWKDSIKIIRTDVLKWHSEKLYDIIISNPPFYENEIISKKEEKNIAHHSHYLKIHELLAIVSQKLNTDGHFFLLLPAKREKEIEDMLHKHQLFIHKKIMIRQSTDHEVFRIMISGSLRKGKKLENEIAIVDKNKNYTIDFTDLLKGYYLKL